MTKPQSSEGYWGPWLKFARTKPGESPIIAWTKNGKSWKRLSRDQSWNIVAMLRGPDMQNNEGGGIADPKYHTTGRVRGLFHSWGGGAWSTRGSNHGRGVGLVVIPPRPLEEYNAHRREKNFRPEKVIDMVEPGSPQDQPYKDLKKQVGSHFIHHYTDVLSIVRKLWGDWPFKTMAEEGQNAP